MYLNSSFSSSFSFNQDGKHVMDFAKTEEIKNILNRYVSLVEHSLPSPAAAKGEESIPLPPAPSTGTSFVLSCFLFFFIFFLIFSSILLKYFCPSLL